MDKYKVLFKPSALKELERISPPWIDRIFARIENLADNPRPSGCKKLRGGDLEWRIRIGDYRFIYTIDDEDAVVDLVAVRHRREVYER